MNYCARLAENWPNGQIALVLVVAAGDFLLCVIVGRKGFRRVAGRVLLVRHRK